MGNIVKYIGPPGTGKTTTILRLIEGAARRYVPHKIGAVSFTRAAVWEMKLRATQALGLSPDDARNIRTIHSLCIQLLGIDPNQIAELHARDFMQKTGIKLDISAIGAGDLGPIGSGTYTDMFNHINILRNRLVPVSAWPKFLRPLWRMWNDWITSNYLCDYTGLLERTLQAKLVPNIEILFIDEAQDLTPLQFCIIKEWSKQCGTTVYVGDSDQGIYRWAGAIPESFIRLEHNERKILSKSYRVPSNVLNYSMSIIQNAKDREDVTFAPRSGSPGSVKSAIGVDISTLPGNHMLLTRCKYQLKPYLKELAKAGTHWHNPYREHEITWNLVNSKAWKAIVTYKRLKEGYDVSEQDIAVMASRMVAKGNIKRGFKSYLTNLTSDMTWKMFDLPSIGFTDRLVSHDLTISDFRLNGVMGEYARLFFDQPVKRILGKPRVIVGTIHSVKGGQADNVWLDCRTSRQSFNDCRIDERLRGDEARVFYVGATRARENLRLLNFNSKNALFTGGGL